MDESEGRFDADVIDRCDRELEMQRQTGLAPRTKKNRDWLLQVQLKMSRRKPALDELGRK